MARAVRCAAPGRHLRGAGAIAGPIIDLDARGLYFEDPSFRSGNLLKPEVFHTLARRSEAGDSAALAAAPVR